MLAACARHVRPGGSVLIQSYPPSLDWIASVGVERRLGDVAVTIVRAEVDGKSVDAVVEYAVDGTTWRQPFSARMLDQDGLAGVLDEAKLRFVRWLDDGRSLSEARKCENRGR